MFNKCHYLLFLFCLFLLFPFFVSASCDCTCWNDYDRTNLAATVGKVNNNTACQQQCTSFGSQYFKCLAVAGDTAGSGNNSGGSVTLPNPLGKNNKPEVIIGNVIKQVLGVVGSLALVMFIYGGVVWMTSAGSSEKVEKGKNIIVWAVIGLVVIFSSYALVKFVIETAAGT